MITRNALYTFIESTIDAADVTSPLFGASSFRNLRGSVDAAAKVIRVEVFTGELTRADADRDTEKMIEAEIQCWVTPVSTTESDLDTATDESFDMAKTLHDAIADNPGLDGTVCDAQFRKFETGFANIGSTRMGVTYLDGLINQVS